MTSIWDDPGFHEPAPYLGGQVAAEYFIASAEALPNFYESWQTALISSAFGEQFPLVWAGELDLDTAIAIAIENAEAAIEKNAPGY